eukprot:768304-Hanusia_phi.AAC.1
MSIAGIFISLGINDDLEAFIDDLSSADNSYVRRVGDVLERVPLKDHMERRIWFAYAFLTMLLDSLAKATRPCDALERVQDCQEEQVKKWSSNKFQGRKLIELYRQGNQLFGNAFEVQNCLELAKKAVKSNFCNETHNHWLRLGNNQDLFFTDISVSEVPLVPQMLKWYDGCRILVMRINEGTEGDKGITLGLLILLLSEDEVNILMKRSEELDKQMMEQESSERPARIELKGRGECEGYRTAIEMELQTLSFLSPSEFVDKVKEAFRSNIHTSLSPAGLQLGEIERIQLEENDDLAGRIEGKPDALNYLAEAVRCYRDDQCQSGCSDQESQLIMKFEVWACKVGADKESEGAEEAAEKDVKEVLEIDPVEAIYPEQKMVAQRILDRLKYVLEEKGIPLSKFTELDFAVLLPNFVSLKQQTESRVLATLFPNLDVDIEKKVVPLQPNLVTSLKERILKLNDSTLFVLISDESHWE